MKLKRAWLATGIVLVASSLLYSKRDGIHSLLPEPTYPRVRSTYRYFASLYNQLVNLFVFGQERPIRCRVAELANLHPGDTVLDLACGTGRNFPYLLERVGPTGRVIGLDYTPEMLAEARRTVEQEAWRNVELILGDAAQLSIDQLAAVAPETSDGVDAVISTFAMSVIPEWEAAIRRAIQILKPGGRMVLGGVKFSTGGIGRPFNWLADLLGGIAAADLGRRPWELLSQLLEDVTYEERFFGFFYIASGRKA
jgi:demethylmenaquinone methyltransferase/2-methoxy-6-polyprenyl-1,4-benzoquinol methylase